MSAPGSLHIAVVIDDLAIGGAQLLLPGFAAGARQAGIEVSVAYLHDRTYSASALREQGVEPVLVPVSSLVTPADHRRVRRHLADLKPDIVHTHIGAADVVGGIAARSLGIPAVSTIHSTHWSGLSASRRIKLGIQVAARRYCDQRVITVAESVRSGYLGRGWHRPERVVTVHNGILDRSSGVSATAVRRELGLAPEEVVVTLVGALARDKGQSILAAAARDLTSRFPDMTVLIVGDGPLRREIEREVSELGDHARMIGHRDDVPAVLAASDVLAHPTRVDALPTVLIEAMAAGLPVVATAIGGVPEMLRDGEQGILMQAPPDPARLVAALEPVLASAELRERLGGAARERFEQHFTVERWFERLLPVYGAMLNSGSPGS